MMKPHYQIPIVACDEPLVPISNCFDFPQPHAYQALGAPYGDRSPYWLRREVCDRLCQAQAFLQTEHPQWRLSIFDAYRPIAVQQFMVDYSLQQLLQERGLEGDRRTSPGGLGH
jgi:D-alanyl-D-alanine dipeptidase